MSFPAYGEWIRRYRPSRRLGPLYVGFSPDHLPWPEVFASRGGHYLEVGAQIGPLGPDPVLAVWVRIPRPGSSR